MNQNISFFIRKDRPDKKGLVPIFAQVTIKSKVFQFQIEKTKIRYWNPTKQRVYKNRENEQYNRHEEINSLLDRLSLYTSRFRRFDNCISAPSKEEVKSILLSITPSKKSFKDVYDEFIEINRNKVAYNTTKGRVTAKKFIEKYQEHYGIILDFEDINLQLFDKLYDFAFDELDLETNAFVSYIAKFKAFLNWANDKGYYSGIEHRKYTCSEKEKNVICLTPDEFKTLYAFDFKIDRLDKARDLYCFGCLTGLRFSDIKTLRYEHINGDYISKNITKTKENDLIPILPQARKIIEKYKGNGFYPLPRISNQKLNDYIKECCELANIDTPVVKLRYKGNRLEEQVFPKYKVITVHTARKTFITIGFTMGLDVKTIKSITGHKKETTFDKYLKIADDFKREKLLNAWKDI